MPISKFRITNAGPFDDITFEFDDHVNVFVGPNNSGKSTALLALAEATVFPFIFPRKFLKGSESKWDISLSKEHEIQEFSGFLPIDMSQELQTKEVVELLSGIGYTIFIPSLRRSTDFRSKGPTIGSEDRSQGHNAEEAARNTATEMQPRAVVARLWASIRSMEIEEPELRKRRELIATDSALVSDESVIQKMVDLDYAGYRRNQPQIHHLLKMVAGIASEITESYPIEFLRVGEDERGLFPEFYTIDGNLPLNLLSQGTQSIVQWLAHFLFGYAQYYDYPENLTEKPGILIVDEIDVHLHPSWQRRIIPALTKNFPNLQIFCSTHSPLMLAGLGEGQVQLLNRDADGKVVVSPNRWDMAGWSAEEILRNVLEVRDTIDIATASEIDRMGELSIKDTLTDEEAHELEEIRNRVSRGLLDGPPSSQVESFLQFIKEVYSRQASNAGSSGRTRPRVRRRENGAT